MLSFFIFKQVANVCNSVVIYLLERRIYSNNNTEGSGLFLNNGSHSLGLNPKRHSKTSRWRQWSIKVPLIGFSSGEKINISVEATWEKKTRSKGGRERESERPRASQRDRERVRESQRERERARAREREANNAWRPSGPFIFIKWGTTTTTSEWISISGSSQLKTRQASACSYDHGSD